MSRLSRLSIIIKEFNSNYLPWEYEKHGVDLYKHILKTVGSSDEIEVLWKEHVNQSNPISTCYEWYNQFFTYCQRRGCSKDCPHYLKYGKKLY